jgi:hypothetical protein
MVIRATALRLGMTRLSRLACSLRSRSPVILLNRRCVLGLIAVVLACSMLGCVHRSGLSPTGSVVAGPSEQTDGSASPTGRRAQKDIDDVLGRLKQSARARPSPTPPPSGTRASAEPQPVGTQGTLPPPAYNVVILTQPTQTAPSPEASVAAGQSSTTANRIDHERATRRLRPSAATFIAAALIAAIVCLPRLRHRPRRPPA